MIALEIKTIGTSAGVTLPPEALALLHVKEGDTLYLSATPEGVLLSPHSPERTRQMEIAEEIMREDQDVLRELAK
jgi:putative addiction module antidote